MGINQLDTIDFDYLTKQLSIKVLSNHHDLYAMWVEKERVVMQIHYSKKENKIKLLKGTLGNAIKSSELTEDQKIGHCTEALRNALWVYYRNKHGQSIRA